MTVPRFCALAGAGLAAAIALTAAALAQPANPLRPLPVLAAPKAEQVALGRLLFFDPRLSGDGALSCADCHDPAKGWADRRPLSKAYPGSEYFRKAPSLMNVAYQRTLYWDGRLSGKDLATQVRDALTEAHFMNADGRLLMERLKQVPEYVTLFTKAFGPGDPSFGKILNAVAAFEQTLVSRNVPFDRYLAGDQAAISDEAKRGLALFQGKAGCIQCHAGPLLSDGRYHALGVPENPDILENPERHFTLRRFYKTLGVPNYANERTDVGRFAVTKDQRDRGKFRTPSLREVGQTPPYMHNGMLASLEAVVAFYDRGGGEGPNKSPLLRPLGLDAGEQRALVSFLHTLSGEPIRDEQPDLPDYAARPFGKN